MIQGAVVVFNATRGYGFIQPENLDCSVFVHHSALEAAGLGGLKNGQDVVFDIETDGNGRQYVANLMLA